MFNPPIQNSGGVETPPPCLAPLQSTSIVTCNKILYGSVLPLSGLASRSLNCYCFENSGKFKHLKIIPHLVKSWLLLYMDQSLYGCTLNTVILTHKIQSSRLYMIFLNITFPGNYFVFLYVCKTVELIFKRLCLVFK